MKINVFGIFCCLLFAASCANQVALQGGPKDVAAPKIDSLKSTPNGLTNFQKQVIELRFNEWIVLQDANNQILVSPPLVRQLKVELSGKVLRLKFDEDETLRPNVTYHIDFGQSVKDLTESNITKNLSFVFATGQKIDSLSLRGKVTDAYTGKPAENAWVMLYDSWLDSTAARRERPLYATKTTKEGSFLLENLRKDTFTMAVLIDANRNYLFDQATEKIGFIPLNHFILEDSFSTKSLALRIFENEKPLKLVDKNLSQNGLIFLKFNQIPLSAVVDIRASDAALYTEPIIGDSLRIWYHFADTLAHNWKILVHQKDSLTFDTVNVKTIFSKNSKQQFPLLPTQGYLKGSKFNIHSDKNVEISFNHPLSKTDATRIQLFADTALKTPISLQNISIDSVLRSKLIFNFSWKPAADYTLVLLPNAVTDFNGAPNSDTILQKYTVTPTENLAEITFNLDSLDARYSYLIRLMIGENKIAEQYIENKAAAEVIFRSLDASESYVLRILEDRNRNKIWDTGSYDRRREPEYFFVKSLEPVQAGFSSVVPISFQRQADAAVEGAPAPPASNASPTSRKAGKGGN